MNQKKIVITDTDTLGDIHSGKDVTLNAFSEMGEVTSYPGTTVEEIPERIADADIILCNKTPLTKENLKYATHVKYIGLFATGYNNVDLKYCREHGITVCNAGHYSTDAVAQHTFALILHHFSQVSSYDSFIREDGWIHASTFSPIVYPMQELAGKTIGIIGYGSIGQATARIAKAFSMKVLANVRTPKEDSPYVDAFVSRDELLANADIVTIHCPLNADSADMCNTQFFAKCKKGAFFVNTSRGGVVVEKDLRDAVLSGQLSGAGVDVLRHEPMREDCPLRGIKEITITPHIAWSPTETRQRAIDIAADNLKKFLVGKPQNVVS